MVREMVKIVNRLCMKPGSRQTRTGGGDGQNGSGHDGRSIFWRFRQRVRYLLYRFSVNRDIGLDRIWRLQWPDWTKSSWLANALGCVAFFSAINAVAALGTPEMPLQWRALAWAHAGVLAMFQIVPFFAGLGHKITCITW